MDVKEDTIQKEGSKAFVVTWKQICRKKGRCAVTKQASDVRVIN